MANSNTYQEVIRKSAIHKIAEMIIKDDPSQETEESPEPSVDADQIDAEVIRKSALDKIAEMIIKRRPSRSKKD